MKYEVTKDFNFLNLRLESIISVNRKPFIKKLMDKNNIQKKSLQKNHFKIS